MRQQTKKEVRGFRTLVQKIRNYFKYPNNPLTTKTNWYHILRFRLGRIENWTQFKYFVESYTTYADWFQYLTSPAFRGAVKYEKIIKNIPKDYDWIKRIDRIYEGDTGVDEYWLAVVMDQKVTDTKYKDHDWFSFDLQKKFEADLKARIAKLNLNPKWEHLSNSEWYEQIRQEGYISYDWSDSEEWKRGY